MEKTKDYGAKIYHLLPVGFTPPLMIYALKRVSSEMVVQLDSGEEVSEVLLKEVNNLMANDAYAVRRIEKPYNSYSWQVRVFRKSKAIFLGYHHEMISVNNKIVKLKGKDFFISGMTDLGNLNKMKNYLALDLLERPLTYSSLFSKIQTGKRTGKSVFADLPASWVVLLLYKLVLFYYTVVSNSNAEELKLHLRYLNLHQSAYKNITPDCFDKLTRIRREIEASGGPIKYLCFDDLDYVDSISNSEAFEYDGISIFFYLVNFRFENGKCAPEIDYKELKTDTLYTALMDAFFNALNGKSSKYK